MKARVYVWMKSTVLDPQGKTVCAALQGHGHTMVAVVRQGIYFVIALAPGTDREGAVAEMEAVAKDVLSNPVIEDYRVEILES